MTVKELIEDLECLPPDAIVMTHDVVAYRHLSSPHTVIIEKDHADDHADCEDLVGETVVVL